MGCVIALGPTGPGSRAWRGGGGAGGVAVPGGASNGDPMVVVDLREAYGT